MHVASSSSRHVASSSSRAPQSGANKPVQDNSATATEGRRDDSATGPTDILQSMGFMSDEAERLLAAFNLPE